MSLMLEPADEFFIDSPYIENKESFIELAELLLVFANIELVLPINIDRVCERLGLRVFYCTLGVDQSGAITENKIIVDNSVPMVRQRFTLGHEIAEFLLKKLAKHNSVVWNQLTLDSLAKERMCEKFAANLLIPRLLLSNYLPQILTLEDLDTLAHTFQVSIEAMSYRLMEVTPYPQIIICCHYSCRKNPKENELPKLRVKWGCSSLGYFIPSYKSISDQSLIYEAYKTHQFLEGVEEFELVKDIRGYFAIQVIYQETRNEVLAVLTKLDTY